MSSNLTGPFKTTRVVMPDGRPLFNLQEVYVVQGTQIMPGHVCFIDISGKEAGSAPTIRATVHDAVSHTLNTGIAIVPTKKQVGPGLRHVSDKESRGVRFCRMYQYDDNGNRRIAQDEIDFLFAWAAEHGRTGGTGDPSQHPNAANIPWKPWTPQPGKDGGTGPGTGPDVVDGQGGGKDTGGGQLVKHPADTREPFGQIDKQEKQAFERENPGREIKKGPYTDPDEVNK